MAASKRTPARPRQVFLSHSHHDVSLTKKIASELQRHKIKAWFSEHHIQVAKTWLTEIGTALKRCDWFIVLLTPESVKSKWVIHEVVKVLADNRYDGRVVPVLVKECKIPDPLWPLSNFQIITHKNLPTTMRALLNRWNVRYRTK